MHKAMKHLEHLRTKPEAYRRRIAFLVSSGITFLIFIFWLASLTSSLSDAGVAPTPVTSVSTSLSGSVIDSFGAFKDTLASLFSDKKSATSSIQVLPGSMNHLNQNNQ